MAAPPTLRTEQFTTPAQTRPENAASGRWRKFRGPERIRRGIVPSKAEEEQRTGGAPASHIERARAMRLGRPSNSGFLACILALQACGPTQRSPRTTSAPPSNGPVQAAPSLPADAGAGTSSPLEPAPPPKVGGSFRADIAFSKFVNEKKDLSATDLDKELGVGPSADRPLTFDPTTIRYFKEVAGALSLSAEEKTIFGKQGVVVVDHVQRYGMSSAYHAIYTRDLPVLVTTDSILHALHRSYDDILKAPR